MRLEPSPYQQEFSVPEKCSCNISEPQISYCHNELIEDSLKIANKNISFLLPTSNANTVISRLTFVFDLEHGFTPPLPSICQRKKKCSLRSSSSPKTGFHLSLLMSQRAFHMLKLQFRKEFFGWIARACHSSVAVPRADHLLTDESWELIILLKLRIILL